MGSKSCITLWPWQRETKTHFDKSASLWTGDAPSCGLCLEWGDFSNQVSLSSLGHLLSDTALQNHLMSAHCEMFLLGGRSSRCLCQGISFVQWIAAGKSASDGGVGMARAWHLFGKASWARPTCGTLAPLVCMCWMPPAQVGELPHEHLVLLSHEVHVCCSCKPHALQIKRFYCFLHFSSPPIPVLPTTPLLLFWVAVQRFVPHVPPSGWVWLCRGQYCLMVRLGLHLQGAPALHWGLRALPAFLYSTAAVPRNNHSGNSFFTTCPVVTLGWATHR